MPRPTYYLMAAVAAFLLLYLGIRWLLPEQAAIPQTPQADAGPARIKPAPRPLITIDESRNPRWVKSLAQSSLAGSEVDRVQLPESDNDTLALVPGILVYFDYFLSLRGEMAMQRIKQIVWDDIHNNFTPAIAAQLYELFERYLAYSDAIDEYLATLTHEQVLQEDITTRQVEQQFQPQFFSHEEIDKLFAGYKKMLDYTPEAKKFSKKFRQYRNTPEEYRFAMATELFGAEAAGRLQALEQERQQWRTRLQDYYRQKQQILASPDLDKQGKQQAVQALLERSFNKQEQIRVGVWEKHLRKPNTKEQK